MFMNNKNKMLRLFECYQIPNYPQYELHYNDDEQLIYSNKRKKYLKNSLNPNGYYQVNLYNSEGKKTWWLHRIVYTCLKGDIPEYMQVNHINECKTDNRIENLNLMSPKDNCNYGTRNQRRAEKKSIPIIGVHKKTYDIIEFVSSNEAERVNRKFHHSNIIQCCQHKTSKQNKKILTVNGYYWFYKEEFNQLLEKFNGDIKNIIEYKISKYG